MENNKLSDNITIYWVLATCLATWFLFIHSPPVLIERKVLNDPPFLAHLFGAYTIYMACIHNTLLTPTMLRGKAQTYHVYVGRVGMIAGIVSFIFGLYLSWWPSRTVDKGFAIGVSIGGTLQIFAQVDGYRSIKVYKRLKARIEAIEADDSCMTNVEELRNERDTALEKHIMAMISLFVAACSIPAIIRVVDKVPDQYTSLALPIAITLLLVCVKPYAKVFITRIEFIREDNAVPLTQTE